MSLRRVFLAIASIVLGIALIALLIRLGRIDLRLTWHQLEGAGRISLLKLVLLNALLIYLSTQKWRSIDAVLRHATDSVPSRTTSFAVTSVGMALGLVLPIQLGMTAARTFGTYVYGSALKRGTAGTLYEQSFDLLTVVFLSFASGAAWFHGGRVVMWSVSAVLMTALALLAAGPSVRLVRWLASYPVQAAARQDRIGALLRGISELQHSGVLSAALARRLVVLSAARFAAVVLMAGQTAEAIGAPIPLWHMAAAMPFAAISNVLAVTPGGIGVNELTSATALHLFGTPLALASQWALANRCLGTASCFAVAACALLALGIEKSAAPGKREANEKCAGRDSKEL